MTTTWQAPSTRWSCDSCFSDWDEIGYIAPGLALIVRDGTYALIGGQGHNGDTYIVFDRAPRPDPIVFDEHLDELDVHSPEAQALAADSDAWLEEATTAMAKLATFELRDAYHLVGDLIAAGYRPDEDGTTTLWLYDQIGQLIAGAARTA